MRVAVIGSRNLCVPNLQDYLPEETSAIISGGARGIDTCARDYAHKHNIPLLEFLPEYEKYGRSAPIKRNLTILQNSDVVLAFWDGSSRGTYFVIRECKRRGIPCRVFLPYHRVKNPLND